MMCNYLKHIASHKNFDFDFDKVVIIMFRTLRNFCNFMDLVNFEQASLMKDLIVSFA